MADSIVDAADAAAGVVRDAGASTLSQLKPDAQTRALLAQLFRTAAEPHLLNYLAYPLGLSVLALFVLRASAFAPARAKNDTADGGAVRVFALYGLAAAVLTAYYFVQNSIWSFSEFEERAHLVANLISPLPSPTDHPLTVLGAHVQRSIDWLYDSQPLSEGLRAIATHEGVWWWAAERLVFLSGAWLVLLQAEGHRLVIPYRPLYAIIALLGPLSLAAALLFLALVTRAVPDGTLSNSADFILAADPKGSFHALAEASKAQAANAAAEGIPHAAPDATLQQTRSVTSTRSRLARPGFRRTPSQQAMPPPEILPNGQQRGEEVIEEQQIAQGELDLDPPYHVLSHLTLWLTYWSALLFVQHGRGALNVPQAREHYFQFGLSVLAPFLLPLVLKLPTSLPVRLAGTLEHLHNHLKDGWLFLALFAASIYFKAQTSLDVYRFLAQAVGEGKHVPLSLIARFLLFSKPVVLQPHSSLLHPSRQHNKNASLVPPAASFAVYDMILASLITATWILYDRARLQRVDAFPARSHPQRWRLHAHVAAFLALGLLSPAAGLSLWAMQREAVLSANEVRDERRLGRSLHLGARRSMELKHHVHVEQHKTRVIIRSDTATNGHSAGAGVVGGGLRPPTDSVPALATLAAASGRDGLTGALYASNGNGEAELTNGRGSDSGAVASSSRAARAPTATSGRASSRRQATLSPGPSEGYSDGQAPATPRSRRSTARTRQ